MDTPQVVIVFSPPSFDLWFENLDENLPQAVAKLQMHCPWMRWDKESHVWHGPITRLGQTLRFCHGMFNDEQITILRPNSSKQDIPRQLRMF